MNEDFDKITIITSLEFSNDIFNRDGVCQGKELVNECCLNFRDIALARFNLFECSIVDCFSDVYSLLLKKLTESTNKNRVWKGKYRPFIKEGTTILVKTQCVVKERGLKERTFLEEKLLTDITILNISRTIYCFSEQAETLTKIIHKIVNKWTKKHFR